MKIDPVLNVPSLAELHPSQKKPTGGFFPVNSAKRVYEERDFSVTISGRDGAKTPAPPGTTLSVYENPGSTSASLPQRGYGFRVDINNKSVMVVTDKASGEVVKQIPTEEQQRIDASLERVKESLPLKKGSFTESKFFNF